MEGGSVIEAEGELMRSGSSSELRVVREVGQKNYETICLQLKVPEGLRIWKEGVKTGWGEFGTQRNGSFRGMGVNRSER